MRRLLLPVLIAIVLFASSPVLLAREQAMKPNRSGLIEFSLPSGNIGCTYAPEGGTANYKPVDGGPELKCDRTEPSYVTVVLGPDFEAEATDDPDEQACCSLENTLEYDNEVTFEGFICHAEVTGLACQTTTGEHGFLMSRSHVVTY